MIVFLELLLAAVVAFGLRTTLKTRRIAQHMTATSAEMDAMAAEMRARMPGVLRDLPPPDQEILGGPPSALVVVAFGPGSAAVALIHPETDDSEEVVQELDRYWASRAAEVLNASIE